MDNVFRIILDMSISSSIVIIFVILIRHILKNILTKAFSYALWGIVLIRLIFPISFENQFSIFNYIPQPINVENNHSVNRFDNFEINGKKVEMSNLIGENIPVNNTDTTVLYQSDVNEKEWLNLLVLSYIWFSIAILILIYFIASYVKIQRKLGDAVLYHIGDETRKVYISDKIDVPVLCGLINARIIVPKNMDISQDELKYIIDHETIHIKRYDYIIKPISLIALCLHWFNPLVWLSFFIAHKDMELSCDEAVMAKHNNLIKIDYANTLLNLSMKQNNLFNGGILAFGEKNIKTRIKAVLNFKKTSIHVKLIGILAVIIFSIVLISNGNTKERMINTIEEHYGYEIKEEDVIDIIERENETLVFHKGYNTSGDYPIYVLSHLEKRAFSWIYRGGYYDGRVIDQMEEYYSTIALTGAGDDNHLIITGVVKGKNIDKVVISSSAENIVDKLAITRKISDSVSLWYTFVDKRVPTNYSATFIDEKGTLLYSIEKSIKDNPIKAIEQVRGYDIPKSTIIDLVETDMGLLVFYHRVIGGGATVYAFELLEETENGYVWLTGGQHSDGRLDNGRENISSVQYVEHLSENIPEGFIFGIMRSKVNDIYISKSVLNSTQPYTPNIVSFGDELALWYSILPEDFGKNYDVVFENKADNIFFVEGNMIQQEKVSDEILEELAIKRIYLDTAELAFEAYSLAMINSDYKTIIALTPTANPIAGGQEIWDTVEIANIKVLEKDIRENKACYSLEINVLDPGYSAFSEGVSPRWLWLVSGENGWYVEGLMTGGEPEESWWSN